MGCFSPDTPAPRDPAQEASDMLAAQTKLAPDIYANQAKYGPLYGQLSLQEIQDYLMGNPSATRTEQFTDMVPTQVQVGTKPIYGPTSGSINSGGQPQITGYEPIYETRMMPSVSSRTVNTPASRGFLDIFQNDILPKTQAITTASRQAEIGDVAALGPAATAAFKAANPQQAALIDEMNRQALSELQLGSALDPSLARQVSQSVRAGQAARGLGYGPSDVFQEAYSQGLAGERLRASRRAYAGQVAGLNQTTNVDPFLAILGRPAQNLTTGQQWWQQGAGNTAGTTNQLASQFDPFSSYGQDLWNTNYNAEAAANIASANNTTALIAAGMKMAGGLFGGMMGA